MRFAANDLSGEGQAVGLWHMRVEHISHRQGSDRCAAHHPEANHRHFK